jgi:ABC-type phosphate/phosphonate transport system ATPase subunit
MSADSHMHYFAMLSREEQHQAIHKLSNGGMSDYAIAAATKLSIEMIRFILGQPSPAQKS